MIGSGSQIMAVASTSEATQDASIAAPTPYGNFNITQLGDAADKATKDDNFRGLSAYNGVIYMSKGSGSNGINTVYFVDTTGNACPSGGIGVPQTGASLPSASSWAQTSNPLYAQFYNGSTTNALGENTANPGLTPANMCVLKGFSTTLAERNDRHRLLPVRPVVRQPDHPLRGRRRKRRGGLDRHDRWPAEVDAQHVHQPPHWSLQYTLNNGLNLQTTYPSTPRPPGSMAAPPARPTRPGPTPSAVSPVTGRRRPTVSAT